MSRPKASPKAPKMRSSNIGETLRQRRLQRKLTLDGLARLSGVSRAAISKIERGEASPTTVILGRLAEALDLSISQFVGGPRAQPVMHIPPERQAVFREEASGFERRSLSPLYRGRGIDVVMNTLPPCAKTGPFPAHRAGVEEHLYVIRGKLKVTLQSKAYRLERGDFLLYQGDLDHAFENLSDRPCEYLIVIDSTRLR